MKKPLDYESKSKRKRAPVWLALFAASAYAVGVILCYGRSWGDRCAIMEVVTIIVVVVGAVVVGVRYGTQDKDFWA